MKAGALTESARHEELATKRTPVFERPVIDTVLDAPVPWLLTLIPVGSLVVAGLLTATLAWLATPTLTPSEPSTEEAPDLSHGRSGMRRVGLASWTGVHALGALGGSAGAGARLSGRPPAAQRGAQPTGH
jgi:hypothetical protein